MSKDDGIAKLPNGLLIPEALRDQLVKQDWSKPRRTADFDPNQATTKDLELKRWSGFRVNVFTNEVELWCLGRIATRRNLQGFTPKDMAEMHEEAFSTTGTVVQVPVQVNRKQRRKRNGKRTNRS